MPPKFLHRSDYQMPGPLGPDMSLPVKVVFLHHTVTVPTANPNADARRVAQEGIARFGKMSYSYLVHPNGTVYEGQGDNIGAHTHNHNSTSLSISLIGNYETSAVSPAMLAGACYCLSVLRTFGLVIARPLVLPHRAAVATACPGQHAVDTVLPFLRAVANDPAWSFPAAWEGL